MPGAEAPVLPPLLLPLLSLLPELCVLALVAAITVTVLSPPGASAELVPTEVLVVCMEPVLVARVPAAIMVSLEYVQMSDRVASQ